MLKICKVGKNLHKIRVAGRGLCGLNENVNLQFVQNKFTQEFTFTSIFFCVCKLVFVPL